MKGKRFFLYGMVLIAAVCFGGVLSGCSSSGAEKGTVTVTFWCGRGGGYSSDSGVRREYHSAKGSREDRK